LRNSLLAVTLLMLVTTAGAAVGDESGGCINAFDPACHTVTGNPTEGNFRGLIMVASEPGVLDTAAHGGTQPGCADCVWSLIPACVLQSPNVPDNQQTCVGAGQPAQCKRGQSLFRLYLTTDAVSNRLVTTLCLGGAGDVVAVGDMAAADVDRYLKQVAPPDLMIRIQPPDGVVANLPAYFSVRPPDDLAPQPFGGPQVTETITIEPARYTWLWGDGTTEQTHDPGGSYPDGTLTHTYTTAGHLHGSVTTRWTATYTITVAGETFGPYDATGGPVPHEQPFPVTVTSAHSHLVDGG
jgi:hypothetical protein